MGRRMGGIKMEEYIEVSAKTKEEAIMNAAIQLEQAAIILNMMLFRKQLPDFLESEENRPL